MVFLSVWFINIQLTLAKNLFTEMPAEAVRPVSSKIFCRISLAMSLADSIPFCFR